MIKIVTVIGARPQIIKAAALSRVIKNKFSDKIEEIIVHTGQHYDSNMSQVFIDELKIPTPNFNLNVGSGGHAAQTSEMITGIENVLKNINPDFLVLYGDTNSTLAGAIAASKIHIPIIHIEAGLRSFNKSMPEEINRIICDHTSSLLFSPTKTGINNLLSEGFDLQNKPPFNPDNPGIFHCGDIMYDNSLYFKSVSDKQSNILKDYDLEKGSFILSTIHRDNNTDIPERLSSIFSALLEIVNKENIPVVLPLHPRTSKLLKKNLNNSLFKAVQENKNLMLLPPVSFLDIIALESNCKLVMTDSGGVQKEAYYFNKPCIIFRSETEWVEIVNEGAAIIANADKELIVSSYFKLSNDLNIKFPRLFGDGKAAEFICEKMIG